MNYQIKTYNCMMNMSSIKKLLLKISQYSQKNTYFGVKIKMQAFSPETLSKRGFNTGFFL